MADKLEKEQQSYFRCFNNKELVKRYFAMLNICLLGLGTFVCFDSVGALQQALMEKFKISFSEFSLMYSVNSWANIIISPFGGFLIDRVFGIRYGTLFYGGVFILGHFIFASGVTVSTFWLSLLGRFFNGVGHEFLYICLQLYSVFYFKGKELSMIMCTNISIARVGSSVVYAISGPLLTYIRKVAPGSHDVGIVLFIIASFMVLTMVSGLALMIITPKESKKTVTENEKSKSDEGNSKKMNFKDLLKWPLQFWLIAYLQVTFVVSIYVFLPFTQELFKTVNGMSIEEANAVTSFFSIVGAVQAPFVGILVDKVGKETYFCQLGLVCCFVAHAIVGFTTWSPYLSMFILSLSYSIFNASVLPMVAFFIPEYKLGTAYGVTMTFGNASYALSVYLAGLIVDKYKYVGLAVFILCVITVGFFVSIWLWIIDRRSDGILNMKSSKRKAIIEEQIERDRGDGCAEPLKE